MKNRKRNRMVNFDYSNNAIYFLTSCCKNREYHFGEIKDGIMHLNDYGKIAYKQIEWLPKQYPYIELHNFVVMPNHVHILLEINRVGTGRDLSYNKNLGTDNLGTDNLGTDNLGTDNVRTGRDLSLRQQHDHMERTGRNERTGHDPSLQPIKIKSISSIMGAYKTTTSKEIHKLGNINFNWQRSFHDHIVRNQQRYTNIFNYITDNPARWQEDTFNTTTHPNFDKNE